MSASVWVMVEGRYDKHQRLIGEKQTGNHAGCHECNWDGPRRNATTAGHEQAQTDADEHNQTTHPALVDDVAPKSLPTSKTRGR